MSSDEDSSNHFTPETIKIDAQSIINDLLPETSKDRYLKAYEDFCKWKTTKGANCPISEAVLLVYFQELSLTKKCSSLWCIYSMLKSTICIKHNIRINTYSRLLAFLKRKSEGHRAKKSKVFTAHNVETFLNDAPDRIYLAVKVALIIGLNGACRGNELVNLEIGNIERHSNELLLVTLPDTKTKRERSFVIRGENARIVEKYQALRPANMKTDRFFVKYINGKCTKQVIGKNKISAMPKEIAKYLKLQNAEMYTGHCFRRTSASLLADSGANMTQIKRHGGWKSDAVAEGYIENSMQNKSQISSRISDNINLESSNARAPLSPQPSTSNQIPYNFLHQRTASLTFTQNEFQTPVSEAAHTINTSTSINVPNKNITLSLHWNNVSNIQFYF